MSINFHHPINFYNDKTRYKTLFILHTIDFIFFIIRLALVSNDISQNPANATGHLIPMLLFELIGSVPIIICDIIYVIMRHCVKPLMREESSFTCLWRTGTLTFIRLNFDKDRPQAILLMRIILIICSLLLKFICFIVGASCSVRYKPTCTAYTVIAAFGLVSTALVIIIEFVHFFRLWNYNPTNTKNYSDRNRITIHNIDKIIKKTHRRHLGFIHYSLLNDQNSAGFRHSRCEKGINCQSESLHHYLFYHSLESEQKMNSVTVKEHQFKSLITFYQTTKEEALFIAQKGFPYGDNSNTNQKDYLHLKQTVYFTRSCVETSPPSEAIICATLNLGRITPIESDENLDLNEHFGLGDGKCDTIYVKRTDRFYLRMPGQIEKWIISIKRDVQVNDLLDGTFYQPCI